MKMSDYWHKEIYFIIPIIIIQEILLVLIWLK